MDRALLRVVRTPTSTPQGADVGMRSGDAAGRWRSGSGRGTQARNPRAGGYRQAAVKHRRALRGSRSPLAGARISTFRQRCGRRGPETHPGKRGRRRANWIAWGIVGASDGCPWRKKIQKRIDATGAGEGMLVAGAPRRPRRVDPSRWPLDTARLGKREGGTLAFHTGTMEWASLPRYRPGALGGALWAGISARIMRSRSGGPANKEHVHKRRASAERRRRS